MIDFFFDDYLNRIIDLIFNSKKRIFIGYLITSTIIALCFLIFFIKLKPYNALKKIFAKKVWCGKSACADYIMIMINQAIMLFLSPHLISSLILATFFFETFHYLFDNRFYIAISLPTTVITFIYTLCYFLIDDSSKYLVHLALHRIKILWSFHKVHHSAQTLTPFTVLRTHPIEAVLFFLRSSLVQAITIATAVFFFGSQMSLITILGVNIIVFIFNVFGANLRHSHICISYGRVIENIFISPAQHQIHHSTNPKHLNKNLGSVLAIWDILGKTHYSHKKGEKISFGIETEHNPHTLKSLYIKPFYEVFNYFIAKLKLAKIIVYNAILRHR